MNRSRLLLALILTFALAAFGFDGFGLFHPNATAYQSIKSASVSPSSLGEVTSLAEAINPDGTLKTTSGSFNTKGYRMELTAGGAPRFVAQTGCSGWDTQFTLPNGVSDTVYALAVSGNDIYIGGDFTAAGNVSANRVAKFNTLTNTWSALGNGGGNGVDDVVLALAVIGSDLYVGGSFTTANVGGTTVSANYVAKVNLATGVWSAMGTGGGKGVNDQVNALAVIGSDLYVGGSFTTANAGGPSLSANRVAKFNTITNTWNALGTGGGNGVDLSVFALAVIGSDLYVGGDFTTANAGGTGTSANHVAKVNPATGVWSALGTGGGNGVDLSVFALAAVASDLYVGGSFTSANVGGAAISANNIAKVNPATGVWTAMGTGGGNGLNNSVFALTVIGSDLYVGGDFTIANVGDQSISANRVAKINPATGVWGALGNSGGNGVINGVRSLTMIGSDLYVGGSFTTANAGGPSLSANRVAKVNSATGVWSALGIGSGNGVNGSVYALAVSGNDIYIGGDFTAAGNVSANRVAKFNTLTNTWSALGTGSGNGVDSPVFGLAIIGSDLYVGGSFTTTNVGGATLGANHVAKVNPATGVWNALGTGGGNGVNDFVLALAVIGSDLYVGGDFTTANVGGSELGTNYVAKFNTITSSWGTLGTGGGNGVDFYVLALTAIGSDLYVGGCFTTANVGGVIVGANHVAKLNPATGVWSALGTGGGNGVDASVFALAAISSNLYVGGDFTTANVGGVIVGANHVAKLNPATGVWSALGTGGGNGVNFSVFALAVNGSDLYVGGDFTTTNVGGASVGASRVAKVNSATGVWNALADTGGGNGMNDTVYALAVVGSSFYAGGGATVAGDNKASVNIGRLCGNSLPTITASGPLFRQQASAASNSTIATVSDNETAAGSLTVTATTVPAGITVTNIINNNGTVTANVAAACNATAGANTVTLTVTDDSGGTATVNLTINVTANSAPALSYNNQTGVIGSALTINPTTVPSDNGSISSIVVQSVGAYTGSIAVNSTTGVVTLTNAKPAGSHTITLRATDNCGATTDSSFTLNISSVTCPAITINPTTLPNGATSTAYNQTLTATGGTAPYTFAATSGAPPSGLTLASGGALLGTPTTPNTYNFTVTATDSAGCTGTRSYTIIISGVSSGSNGLMFYPLPRPVRLLDTRGGQGNCDSISTPIAAGNSLTTLARTTCESITIPANAQAIVGNVTVLNQTAQTGYLTIYPDGQTAPIAANMIYGPGAILSNNFTVGLSSDGKFNIFGEKTIDVVVDISGYYAPPGAGGLYYHPLSKPIRLLDTRPGFGNCDNVSTPIPAGASLTTLARTTCESLTIPTAAQAIVGNATVINGSGQVGYLATYPNGVSVPLAANIVYFPGQILSNAFTVSLSAAGEFNIFAERTIDMVVDVAGYYSNEAVDANGAGLLFTPLARPLRILDTRPGQGNCDSVGAPITGGAPIAASARMTCESITIPLTAQTVLGNVTVINYTAQVGYLTLYPDGLAQPVAANMVYFPNQILSNAFVVGVNGGTGQFRIFAERTLDAIVDVSGYFAP